MDDIHSLYNINEITENPCSKINEKRYKQGKLYYEIWNYDKDFLCFDEKYQTTLCRSVIFSFPEKNLLAYSPGKTIPSEIFCNEHHDQKHHK